MASFNARRSAGVEGQVVEMDVWHVSAHKEDMHLFDLISYIMFTA